MLWEPLDRVVPPESRGRSVVAVGVVAWTGVGLAGVAWLIFFALSRVAGLFPYLMVAALVVFTLNPVVRILVRRGVPRRLAATIVFAVVAISIPPLLTLLVQVIVDQGKALLDQAPGLIGKGGVFTKLRDSNTGVLHDFGAGALRYLHHHHVGTKQILDNLGNAAVRLAHVGIVIVGGGILGYVILLSLHDIRRGSMAMVPHSRREQVNEFFVEIGRVLVGYVKARLMVSAAVGFIATVGLWAIGMPFWLILGLLVGIANLIPVLGSWIGGIPVMLVALLTKPPSFLLVAAAVIVVAHLIDGWILSPMVFKGTLHMHPVVTLLAVVIGAELLGFWGAVLGVPIAGIIQYVVGKAVAPYRQPVEPVPDG